MNGAVQTIDRPFFCPSRVKHPWIAASQCSSRNLKEGGIALWTSTYDVGTVGNLGEQRNQAIVSTLKRIKEKRTFPCMSVITGEAGYNLSSHSLYRQYGLLPAMPQ